MSSTILIAALCIAIPLSEWWRRSLLRREHRRTREAIQSALSHPHPREASR